MPLEFSNDFCAACKPIARTWHKRNDPIGHCSIAIIVVDVDLQDTMPLACLMDTLGKHSLTVLASLNVLLLATKW
jgi:hypothetical protein